MIHHIYEPSQEHVSKKPYHRHHAETYFEDPVKGDFFNYFPQKGHTISFESSTRGGLNPFHYGHGEIYGNHSF
jgi:hypothetical protein